MKNILTIHFEFEGDYTKQVNRSMIIKMNQIILSDTLENYVSSNNDGVKCKFRVLSYSIAENME